MRTQSWRFLFRRCAAAVVCLALPSVSRAQAPGPSADPNVAPRASTLRGESAVSAEAKAVSSRWKLVLSQWSMRGSALRPRDAGMPSAVASLVETASSLPKLRIELSSQLINVDAKLVAKLSSVPEADGGDLGPLRAPLDKTDHVQIRIDHLPPLAVGIEMPPENGNVSPIGTDESESTTNNVIRYAAWIARAESSLSVRTFSLIVAEHEDLREPAKKKAVESLIALAERLSAASRSPGNSRKSTPGAANSVEKPAVEKPIAEEAINEAPPEERTLTEKPIAEKPTSTASKLRILVESGDGFRSEPQWLVEVVQDARSELERRGIQGIDFQILFNLGRRRPEEINPAKLWQPLAAGTKKSPFLAGVIAETAAFVVVPGESEGKIRVVAERRIDYAEALQAISPFAGDEVLVVVRYVGPERYEKEGIAASMALFNTLLESAPPIVESRDESGSNASRKD